MPTPPSPTGLPTGVQAGATGPRLLAALVEAGPVWLLTGLGLLFAYVVEDRAVVVVLCGLLALGWTLLVWAQRAGRAAGPGMRLDSLQIVGFHDGRPIGWRRVVLRGLVFAGLSLTVVGLVAMLVAMARHPRRQGWHDLLADAVVIRERPLAPPRPKPVVARTAAPATPSATVAAALPTAAPPLVPDTAATAVEPAVTEVAEPEAARVVEPEAEAAADRVGVAPEWRLQLDDGRHVDVDGLVLLGRNPQPRAGEEDATLIKVADDTRTVSKSHLAVGVDVNGLYVMDRGSTNGTVVTAPDGGRRPCPPGDLIDVTGGSVISFGDHWLEVRRETP